MRQQSDSVGGIGWGVGVVGRRPVVGWYGLTFKVLASTVSEIEIATVS